MTDLQTTVATSRDAKAAEARRRAAMHGSGVHFVNYTREAEYWTRAAALAWAGDVRPRAWVAITEDAGNGRTRVLLMRDGIVTDGDTFSDENTAGAWARLSVPEMNAKRGAS